VRAYDREARTNVELAPTERKFAYRSSVFRRSTRYVVLGVTFVLERSCAGRPVRYAELARVLGVEPGAQPPLSAVREAVLGLRRKKGMVIDSRDPDSVSAGSFFVNPILSGEEFAALARRVAEHCALMTLLCSCAWPTNEKRSWSLGRRRRGRRSRSRLLSAVVM